MSHKYFGWTAAGSAVLVCMAIVALPAMAWKQPPPVPVDILQDMVFGPANYTTSRTMTEDGLTEIDFALPQGKSFSYIEGKSITLNDGKKTLIISINGADLQVGERHCKSSDAACIVHAIRHQVKNFTDQDSAQSIAILRRTMATLSLQARINEILVAHATLPRNQDDDNGEDED